MRELAILGTGCTKCTKLEENTKQATDQLGLECNIVKVKDIKEIMNYGVMITPCLVIDGKVQSVGKVLSVDDIKALLA